MINNSNEIFCGGVTPGDLLNLTNSGETDSVLIKYDQEGQILSKSIYGTTDGENSYYGGFLNKDDTDFIYLLGSQ